MGDYGDLAGVRGKGRPRIVPIVWIALWCVGTILCGRPCRRPGPSWRVQDVYVSRVCGAATGWSLSWRGFAPEPDLIGVDVI